MQTVAVVPIFVSVGSAVMPTVAAALASVAAVAFKPRELWRLIRLRPALVAGVAGAGLLVIVLSILLIGSRSSLRTPRVAETRSAQIDWAKVAEGIIAQQRAGLALTDPAAVFAGAEVSGTSAAAGQTPSDPVKALPIIQAHDATRSSYAGGASPTNLQPLWSYRPEETMFLAEPLVASNRIYVAGCQADLGSYSGILACLDAQTGKPIWEKSELNNDVMKPYFSSPALSADGKSLLIGQGLHQDTNCALLCFDAETGKLRWSAPTPLHIESSPAIFDDIAVVGAGAIEGNDGRPTGDPGFVMAVRISDGKPLWRQPVTDAESSPAFDADGNVYIGSGFNGNAVVALRSESDEVLQEKNLPRAMWKTPVPYPVTSAITVVDDLIIAGAGNGDVVHSSADPQGLVVAIDRATGSIRWQRAFEDAVLGGVAARGDVLVCPVRTGEVAALSKQDGSILWRSRISGKAPVIASAGFTGEFVYAVSSDGYLALLDARTGEVKEKIALNDPAKPGSGLSLGAAQIANGRVYVGSETGGVRCLVGTEAKP
jgi:outer membrane protein assembly factor BamB